MTDNFTPHLSYLQALILGLVQGITEFLPVSSTAHMRILARAAQSLQFLLAQ